MKRLQQILDRQHKFQKMLHVPIDDKKEQRNLSGIFCRSMQDEIYEVMAEYQNKTWDFKHRKDEKPTNVKNIKIEMVDVFLFFLNLMLVWEMSLEELIELSVQRQKRNEKRASISIK